MQGASEPGLPDGPTSPALVPRVLPSADARRDDPVTVGTVTSSLPETSRPPDRIQLLRETAAGPMSAVFVGDLADRRVAVKLLREDPDGGVEHLLDLRDRARRVGALHHRHHAPVHDVALVGQRFALISPYVDGIDLLDWVDVLGETGRLLPRRVTCEVLRCISVALEAASAGLPGRSDEGPGLWHRDLKPSNVLITRDGELKVTDFATGYTSLAGRAARSGALKKGLVRYLSPERRDGRRVQAEADVYALGILALELLRGRWLRRLHSQNPAHDRHLADVVARLEDLQMRSDSDDRALRNLLLRMVAFDPEARPTVSEMAAAFRGFADRTAGPSLEAFANAHAVPWLEEPPQEPDSALEGAHALIVGRGQPLPEATGDSVAVVTLPDRYDLQLQSGGPETGEFHLDDLRREVTDPRLRALGFGDPADEDLLDEDDEDEPPPETEEVEVEGPPPEAELWGEPAETAEVLAAAVEEASGSHAAVPPTPVQARRGAPAAVTPVPPVADSDGLLGASDAGDLRVETSTERPPPVRTRRPLPRPDGVTPVPAPAAPAQSEAPPTTPVPAASVAVEIELDDEEAPPAPAPPPAPPAPTPVVPSPEDVVLDEHDLLGSSDDAGPSDDLGEHLVLDLDDEDEVTSEATPRPPPAAPTSTNPPPPDSASAVRSTAAATPAPPATHTARPAPVHPDPDEVESAPKSVPWLVVGVAGVVVVGVIAALGGALTVVLLWTT